MTRTLHFALAPLGVGAPGQDGLWKDARVAKNASVDIDYYAYALQHWFEAKAADGFNFHFRLTADAERFADTVVPILRARGVFRREYESDTLRGNLGLPFPVNRYTHERELASV